MTRRKDEPLRRKAKVTFYYSHNKKTALQIGVKIMVSIRIHRLG